MKILMMLKQLLYGKDIGREPIGLSLSLLRQLACLCKEHGALSVSQMYEMLDYSVHKSTIYETIKKGERQQFCRVTRIEEDYLHHGKTQKMTTFLIRMNDEQQ